MLLHQVEELARHQVARVGAEVPRGVGHDRVELAVVDAQPAASVVGDDLHLRVGEHGGDFARLRDELHIARIDLDDGE
jgi:hypothetical protein